MYCQNYAQKKETTVMTFPNKEAIIEMKKIKEKQNESINTKKCVNINADICEILFLLTCSVCSSESMIFDEELLSLIAGILLTI